mmetsp:Transcript_46404/g.135163  ORF Transcript_46404/g.135163 Transcript_46404/m.135163 type:complete len:528 (+) Transcript_46404:912-2495(+)
MELPDSPLLVQSHRDLGVLRRVRHIVRVDQAPESKMVRPGGRVLLLRRPCHLELCLWRSHEAWLLHGCAGLPHELVFVRGPSPGARGAGLSSHPSIGGDAIARDHLHCCDPSIQALAARAHTDLFLVHDQHELRVLPAPHHWLRKAAPVAFCVGGRARVIGLGQLSHNRERQHRERQRGADHASAVSRQDVTKWDRLWASTRRKARQRARHSHGPVSFRQGRRGPVRVFGRDLLREGRSAVVQAEVLGQTRRGRFRLCVQGPGYADSVGLRFKAAAQGWAEHICGSRGPRFARLQPYVHRARGRHLSHDLVLRDLDGVVRRRSEQVHPVGAAISGAHRRGVARRRGEAFLRVHHAGARAPPCQDHHLPGSEARECAHRHGRRRQGRCEVGGLRAGALPNGGHLRARLRPPGRRAEHAHPGGGHARFHAHGGFRLPPRLRHRTGPEGAHRTRLVRSGLLLADHVARRARLEKGDAAEGGAFAAAMRRCDPSCVARRDRCLLAGHRRLELGHVLDGGQHSGPGQQRHHA